jgi:hypothetical protein
MRARSPDEQKQAARLKDQARAKRAALRALRKAKRAADKAGVKLSDWEGEFLTSVETRVETYGRAFRDPEKGGAHSSLSMLQHVKLKEIGAKANGKPRKSGFRRRET